MSLVGRLAPSFSTYTVRAGLTETGTVYIQSPHSPDPESATSHNEKLRYGEYGFSCELVASTRGVVEEYIQPKCFTDYRGLHHLTSEPRGAASTRHACSPWLPGCLTLP
eukprot:3641082-Prymnesium_polylepis.2